MVQVAWRNSEGFYSDFTFNLRSSCETRMISIGQHVSLEAAGHICTGIPALSLRSATCGTEPDECLLDPSLAAERIGTAEMLPAVPPSRAHAAFQPSAELPTSGRASAQKNTPGSARQLGKDVARHMHLKRRHLGYLLKYARSFSLGMLILW